MNPLLNIVHEDGNLLVVHKPADLVCHPTKGDEYSSLISRARLYLRRKDEFHEPHLSDPTIINQSPIPTNLPIQESVNPPQPFHQTSTIEHPCASASGKMDIPHPASGIRHPDTPHLIHRLDRETSGLVVIAKNPAAARDLGRIWETREVYKEYIAIVHGHVAAEQGSINAALGKDLHSRIAIKDCVRSDGSPAQTDFWVEKRFFRLVASDNDKVEEHPFSLLRLTPKSGRKHQIRIHLSHFGHSIVGDKIYGGDEDAYLALVEGPALPPPSAAASSSLTKRSTRPGSPSTVTKRNGIFRRHPNLGSKSS